MSFVDRTLQTLSVFTFSIAASRLASSAFDREVCKILPFKGCNSSITLSIVACRTKINSAEHFHFVLAPIMFVSVLVTLLTGSLFQVAVITGKGESYLWLLDWHRGKFGSINLEIIYPFLNAFGVLFLAVTGIIMWLQMRKKMRKSFK